MLIIQAQDYHPYTVFQRAENFTFTIYPQPTTNLLYPHWLPLIMPGPYPAGFLNFELFGFLGSWGQNREIKKRKYLKRP